ncbi:MAG: hypothetical protein OEU94_01735 [Aquincola sp.]|nr:hypothetical protein [Aquincola sp.]MDH4289825.1 hypothetical protein [Aquincola sp.]MDH5329460.1 hypothetical protein [Aquincola sp.]
MQTIRRSANSRPTSFDDIGFAACLGAIALALALSMAWVVATDPQSSAPLAAAATSQTGAESFSATQANSAARS